MYSSLISKSRVSSYIPHVSQKLPLSLTSNHLTSTLRKILGFSLDPRMGCFSRGFWVASRHPFGTCDLWLERSLNVVPFSSWRFWLILARSSRKSHFSLQKPVWNFSGFIFCLSCVWGWVLGTTVNSPLLLSSLSFYPPREGASEILSTKSNQIFSPWLPTSQACKLSLFTNSLTQIIILCSCWVSKFDWDYHVLSAAYPYQIFVHLHS